MKRLLLLAALAVSACESESANDSAAVAPSSDVVLPGEEPPRKSAAVVAIPDDPAQLDRMILAGYTPHADHLHPPGVNECPLTKGSEVVM